MDEIINSLESIEILKYQQNRYPMFFVDRITKYEPGRVAEGYKNFTYNEWFFPIHFEDEPNVPGFVQLESLTQVFLMTFLTLPEYKNKKTASLSYKNTVFKKKIVPGDKLEIRAELKSFRRGVAMGTSAGYVNGEAACSTELVIGIPDIIRNYIPDSK